MDQRDPGREWPISVRVRSAGVLQLADDLIGCR